MKDYITSIDHKQTKLTIIEANIDTDIVPLVRWLNSFHSIMTRWSCEGGGGERWGRSGRRKWNYLPYIVIWVDIGPDQVSSRTSAESELEQIHSQLNDPSVRIDPICTQGYVHIYHITFTSKQEMKRIQKGLRQTNQEPTL